MMKERSAGFRALIKRLALRVSMSRLMTFGCNSNIPERNIALGYLFYILVGTVLLCLPWSVRAGAHATVIDHIFTVTSAVSTTGLATVDVPGTYSMFGLIVILFLIQMGAIGYMTISSFLMLHITKKISERGSRVMGTAIPAPFGMNLSMLIDSVVKFTFLIEAIGFAALWITFGCLGVETPAWNAIFISISSFCTAGFSTFPDSLCSFSGNVAVNLIVAALSYSGAMGFIVMTDLKRKCLDRHHKVTFTTRVILTITFWMTVAGTAVLLIFPRQGEPADLTTRFLESFFQTMTAMTTVGFNTFDLSTLPAISVLVMSMLRGRKNVTLRGNTLPFYRVNSALTNIIVYGTVLLLGVLALTVSEGFSFSALLFEATSALGTVGISLGITPGLSVAGKIIITLLMYIGRTGVLTLAAALMTHAISQTPAKTIDIAV